MKDQQKMRTRSLRIVGLTGIMILIFGLSWLLLWERGSSRASTPAEIAAQEEFQRELIAAQEEFQQTVEKAAREAEQRSDSLINSAAQ